MKLRAVNLKNFLLYIKTKFKTYRFELPSPQEDYMIRTIVLIFFLFVTTVQAHTMYIKKSPTNQDGIEWGVDNASGFTRWRAYIKGVSFNGQGQNTGWTSANGWWYYDVNSISSRVMFRMLGLESQDFVITYWVFKADGTWEYGAQNTVRHDNVMPTGTLSSPTSGYSGSSMPMLTASFSDNYQFSSARIYLNGNFSSAPLGWSYYSATQYYKDYVVTSVNEYLPTLSPGNYTITSWVEDKAGNRFYEPWGSRSFTITQVVVTPPPPPVVTLPSSPTNFIVTTNSNSFLLSWSDLANNESGYRVYRNGTKISDLGANVVSYTDGPLSTSASNCYTVKSWNSAGESSSSNSCATLTIAPVGPTPTEIALASGFNFPVQSENILSWQSSIPDGQWYDYQPFGSLFNFTTKIHLGADINRGGGDSGQSVYAVNNCKISDFSDSTSSTDGWGKWIMLYCESPTNFTFRLASGATTNKLWFLYAHLGQIAVYKDDGSIVLPAQIVRGVTDVKKGWRIGTVGNANGYYTGADHLHFEARIDVGTAPGAGYQHYDDYRYLGTHIDPIEFIANNRVLQQRVQRVFVHPYDLDATKRTYVSLDTTKWMRQARIDAASRSSLGYSNYLWTASSNNASAASWNFSVPTSGEWDLFVYLPRSYGTASKVRYVIQYADGSIPTLVIVNQSLVVGANNRFFLGRYSYNANQVYYVKIDGNSEDVNPKKIAFDSIELQFVHADGLGGGTQNATDADRDGMDDAWEVLYSLNPSLNDSTADPDGDFLKNLQEYRLGTNPWIKDTDGDTLSDETEYASGFDPLLVSDKSCLDCGGGEILFYITNGDGTTSSTTTQTTDPVTTSTSDGLTYPGGLTTTVVVNNQGDQQAQESTTPTLNNNIQFTDEEGGMTFSCSASKSKKLPIEMFLMFIIFIITHRRLRKI